MKKQRTGETGHSRDTHKKESSKHLRTEKKTDGGWNLRRIAALSAIILLAGLYLVTFVLAVMGDERSAGLLRFCFGMTIFLPIFIWVIIWCMGALRNRHSMASLDILNSNPEERRKMEEAVSEAVDAAGDRR